MSASSASAAKKKVQFNNAVNVRTVTREADVTIDEKKMDACLAMLQDADPTGDRPDPPELVIYEGW